MSRDQSGDESIQPAIVRTRGGDPVRSERVNDDRTSSRGATVYSGPAPEALERERSRRESDSETERETDSDGDRAQDPNPRDSNEDDHRDDTDAGGADDE